MCHRITGSKDSRFHPKRRLPSPESLPAIASLLAADDTCNIKTPRAGALAAVRNHAVWLDLHARLTALDADIDRRRPNGSSEVKRREATRLVSVSQPFANGWLRAEPDGSASTAVNSLTITSQLQRRFGLHLSVLMPTLLAHRDAGKRVDFTGDAEVNHANANRRHHGLVRVWADMARATATGPIVLGDKDNEALTKTYNAGHVSDVVEPGAGAGGKDRIKEIKCFSSAKTALSAGCGKRNGGGNPLSNGHTHAFGNTLEKCVLDNAGVRERGRASDPPFCHKTGKGWVEPHRGDYDDAIRVKRNDFELCLHESFGGGFSPPAVKALHRHAKKAKQHDRTYYTGRVPKNFIPHHTQRASLAVVKGEGEIVDAIASRLKADQVIQDSLNPPGA